MSEDFKNISWPGWETVRLIGRGSFGAVYEIERKVFDETEKAALKVISIPQNSGDIDDMYSDGYDEESITSTFKSHLQSIVAEYSLMRKMNGSANIVNCDDVRYIQHDDGIGWDIFIKMELLTPLTKALTGDVDEKTVIRIAKDLCGALELCKKLGIVHRDIKPQNIFVSAYGDYKLGDFGIAKTVEKTMGGTKIGTYKYMAPEVYNNQPYGSGVDIYSLGLVLYWLLNERRMPFMPLPPEKLKAGVEENSRNRRLSGEKLPEPAHGSKRLKQIVLKACAFDPADRYESAAAMLDDLNKLAGGAEVFSPAVIPVEMPEEKQEDEMTTGPVFSSTNKSKPDGTLEEGTDLTVGPEFARKTPSQQEHPEEQVEEFPQSTMDEGKQNEKKNALKYLLITLGVIASIILFFLLRSCSGKTTTVCNHKWVDLDENRFTLVSFRCIEIPIENQSDDAKAEAFGTAQNIMSEFVNGDATEERFALLAQKYSKSTTAEDGGLYRNVHNGQLEGSINAWCFDEMRDNGDYEIIETSTAYVLVYYLSNGEYYIASETPQYCTTCRITNGEVVPFSSNRDSVINQTDWSEWVDKLPEGITADKYDIEEKTLYRSKTQEITSSTDSNTMDGWELFDTVEANGGFGPWSGWSDVKVDPSETRKVQIETRYRYKDKEITTSSSDVMSGWELYNTTYALGDYGPWSDWSTTEAYESESRQVKTKVQYSYCNITYSTEYTDYGPWSDWQDSAVSKTDLRDVRTREVYPYYYFYCKRCGDGTRWYNWGGPCGACGTRLEESSGTVVWFETPWSSAPPYMNSGKNAINVDGLTYWTWNDGGPKTQYQYRTRSATQVKEYGEYSGWEDTPYSNSVDRDVKTRVVYSYCDRSQVATYHFCRWGDWSDWATDKVSATSDRMVEEKAFYQYCDKVNVTTYYFKRWTEWTEYSDVPVTPSENVEVDTKIVYQYKPKSS